MSDEVVNQAADAVPSGGGEQPADAGQAAFATNQAEATAVPQQSEIVVGNQKFKDVEEFKRAYADLQRGFTQKTQEYSTKIKAFSGLQDIVTRLKSDPRKLEQFRSLISEGATPQEAAREVAQQSPQADPALARKVQELEARLERDNAEREARSEYESFAKSHPDLAEGDLRQIVEAVIKEDEAGRDVSLEMMYRHMWFEKFAPKAISKAQKDTEKAIAANQHAAALGSVPATAQEKKAPTVYSHELPDEVKLKIIRDTLKNVKD